jgi:hypothetical protein
LKIFPGLKWIGLGARTWPAELRFALQTTWPGLEVGKWPVELKLALQTTWPGLEAGEWVVDHDLQFAVVCGRPYSRIAEGANK